MSAEPTPMQRSAGLLLEQGYAVEITEIAGRGNFLRDLFGFVDLVGIRGAQTLAVQTTTAHNAPARLHKIEASPWLDKLRGAGWRLVVHGWHNDGRLREIVVLEGAQQLELWDGTP